MAMDRKAYNDKYWAEHRYEILKKRRERYKKDKKKIDAQNRRWLDANREHWNAYMRDYRKKKKAEKAILEEHSH